MNLIRVGIRSLNHRPLHSFLSILLLSFSLGLIMVLLAARGQMEESFTRNIRGIDMVVGAKGSPLQLILSSVYHVDAPTGNISLEGYEKLAEHRLVKKAIPLAYGDNFQGFRIVGTSSEYPAHYEASVASSGRQFAESLEATIGAQVAQKTSLKVGDTFESTHGMQDNDGAEKHEHRPYRVVGIYDSTGTVIDQLILTPLASVWAVHDHGKEAPENEGQSPGEDHEHGEAKEGGKHQDHQREITAGLLSFSSPMATMTLPRHVNKNTDMQAALPSIEINRLFSLADSALELLQALALILMLIAAISIFTALLQILRDEEPQLAFLRAMGASRGKITALILTKGLVLSFLGFILALILSQAALWGMGQYVESSYQYRLSASVLSPENGMLGAGALALGLLSALPPAIRAYFLNISKTLANA